MLTHWTQKITKLRTDKNHKRWDETTSWQAPHKPFLLLAIMDLLEAGRIAENRIHPTRELVEAFVNYWDKLFPQERVSTMAYPFPRLQGDGVLTLIPLPEVPHPTLPKDIHSLHRLRCCYSHAKLDENLYHLMLQPDTREVLRTSIIEHYFAPDLKPIILSKSSDNKQTGKYARYLLNQDELDPTELKEIKRSYIVRDRGFRSALLPLYDNRCAICGIKITTPEEHHVIEAAHIIPWSVTHNDHLTNGLSLCRLCHWSFDRGMLGIDKDHQVLVSRHLKSADNCAGHLLTLEKRPIFPPKDATFVAGLDNLAWHRKNVFIK